MIELFIRVYPFACGRNSQQVIEYSTCSFPAYIANNKEALLRNFINQNNMETCCVVGATGYVGSHVTRELLKKGYRVRATCRDPARAEWLKALVPGAEVELHALKLTPEGFPADNPLERIVSGCKGVFLCAGYEKQELSTIDFMVNAATAVLSAACKNADATCVVLTSSTGSTNPPGAAADALKNEAEDQKSRGKFLFSLFLDELKTRLE